jgi:hypothetical protein
MTTENAEILSDIDKAAGGVEGEYFAANEVPKGSAAGDGGAQNSASTDAVAGVLAGGLQVTFGILAKRRGEHWALDPLMAAEAGKAYAAVINKYFPNFAAGPEFAAIAISIGIFAGPIAAEMMMKEAANDGAQPEQ